MWSGIWSVATTRGGCWTWIWSMRLWIGVGKSLLISMLAKLKFFCLTGLITFLQLIWIWIGLLLRKNHILKFWFCIFLLNWIRALTLSLLRKLSKKIEAMKKFLSPKVAVCLYESVILPQMEWCYHIWAVAPSCSKLLLDNVRWATKMDMEECWSFTYSLWWTLGSSSK